MGVQDVIDRIVRTVTGFTGGNGSGGSGPGVMDRVDAVEAACKSAIHRDQLEAAAHWAASAALGPITAAFTAARIAFDSQVGQLTSKLDADMARLRAAVARDILPHEGVPAKLQGDVEHWKRLAGRTRTIQGEVQSLAVVPGWNDDAAREYALATKVQATAMDELEQIMLQTGGSCQQAMVSNIAGLMEVKKALTGGANDIKGGPGFGLSLYRRTAAAIVVVNRTAHLVEPTALAAYKSGMKIDQYIDTVMSTTGLPPLTWPSGTSADGIPGR